MKTWFKPGQVKTKAAKNPVVNRVRAGAVVHPPNISDDSL
jgi:hypothetical protein